MKVGIQYPLMVPDVDDASIQRRYQEFFDDVSWVDEHGYDAIWVTEHHFSNYSVTSSPLLLLAKAAQITTRVRLGTAILVLPIWDPVRLVADVSTLDVISEGRLELGIGRGYQPHELRGFGQDPQRSRERFEEAVEVMLQLFDTPDATFHGQHFNIPVPVTVLPRPKQQPRPPIWMAASSPESIKFAAAKGFHFMTPTTWTTPELAIQREFIAECIREAGESPVDRHFEANRFVYCGTDEEELERAMKAASWQTTAGKELLQGAMPVRGVNPVSAGSALADAAVRDRVIAGSPDEIVAQFEALADAGVTYVLVQFRFGGLSADFAARSMRRFTDEVLPRLESIRSRALTPATAEV